MYLKTNKLLVFLLTNLCVLTLSSQVVQIGTGTTTNGITQASPVNTYYRRTVCQFVYTAAEINAAGATGPNELSALGFFITANPVYNIPGYTVKIKHTNQTNVNAALGTTGWTTVKNSFTYSPSPGGFDDIVFDAPFAWDGVQNIAVEICWSQIQPTWDASGQCRIFASNRGFRYSRDDNAGSICGSSPATRQNYKPQVQLTFKTTSTWNGSVDLDWFNPSNWDAGVPDSEMDAYIPALAINMPTIPILGAECKDLEIENGASLSLIGLNELSINGNLTNNGILNANQGEIILTGKNPNIINGANNQDIYDLTVSNVNGAIIGSGSLNIRGSLKVGIAAGSFNTNNAVTLISDATETARIPELASLCLYTLDMSDSYGDSWNDGYITVYIDGVSAGTYFAKGSNTIDTIPVGGGSTLDLVYTAGSFENENSYTLYDPTGTAIFSDGPTPATGTVFSTVSNCAFFNPIAGNITMQRYIDAGETNWRFLASSVGGTTLADWDDDFITSGYTGSDHPDWPSASNPWSSIYFYDEAPGGDINNGFVAATNATNAVGVGEGVWVWSGDTITGTQPFTIDVTGPPTAGDVNLPVSYTNSGSPSDDGWSMVGNPYPCPIDWDAANWTKNNINNAVYIWNPDNQQFATYVSGIGLNGGSRYIASSQAFWVQTNAVSPSLQITESCKYDADQSFIKQGTLNQQLLKFTLETGGKFDEAALRFIDGATAGFDASFDAFKMESADEGMPYLAMVNSDNDFAVNSFDLGQHVSIPIKTVSANGGMAKLMFEKDNLNDLSCAILEDLKTGVITDIMEENELMFYIHSADTAARFILHIWNNGNETVQQPTCFGSSDGEIVVTPSGYGSWTYNWTLPDESTISETSSDEQIILNNLSDGEYELEIIDESGTCPNYSKTFEVEAPLAIQVVDEITMPSDGLSNGSIDLSVSGGSGSFIFDWSTGDTTEDISGLSSGVYEVNITDNNGCLFSESFNLDITTGVGSINDDSSVNIFPNPANNLVNINVSETYLGGNVQLLDLNGRIILTKSINETNTTIDLSKFAAGMYYYNISSKKSSLQGKLIISR